MSERNAGVGGFGGQAGTKRQRTRRSIDHRVSECSQMCGGDIEMFVLRMHFPLYNPPQIRGSETGGDSAVVRDVTAYLDELKQRTTDKFNGDSSATERTSLAARRRIGTSGREASHPGSPFPLPYHGLFFSQCPLPNVFFWLGFLESPFIHFQFFYSNRPHVRSIPFFIRNRGSRTCGFGIESSILLPRFEGRYPLHDEFIVVAIFHQTWDCLVVVLQRLHRPHRTRNKIERGCCIQRNEEEETTQIEDGGHPCCDWFIGSPALRGLCTKTKHDGREVNL